MPSPDLREVQRRFWASLHSGEPDPGLAACVLPSAALAPAERIRIYTDMYFARLLEALQEDFPRTAAVMAGEFQPLCRRYLARYPSIQPSLRDLGTRLPDFITDEAQALGPSLAGLIRSERGPVLDGCPPVAPWPWLADLARLERARVDVFDAPDVVPLRLQDLAPIPAENWGDLRFSTIPAFGLVRSAWPVHQAWTTPTAAALVPERTALRIWRQDFRVFHAPLGQLEEAALEALSAGEPYAAICELVAQSGPAEDAPARAGALLARWLDDELLVRLAA